MSKTLTIKLCKKDDFTGEVTTTQKTISNLALYEDVGEMAGEEASGMWNKIKNA